MHDKGRSLKLYDLTDPLKEWAENAFWFTAIAVERN